MKIGISPVLHFCLVPLAFLAAPFSARGETFDGFVTRVVAPSDFYLGPLHVVMDGKTICRREPLDAEIEVERKPHQFFNAPSFFALKGDPDSEGKAAVACESVGLTVGSHVQIAGDATGPDGSLLAARATFYQVDIRQEIAQGNLDEEWDGGALLEEQPQVRQTAKGWTGTIWLNGYPMAIAPDTKLLSAASGSRLSNQQFGGFFAMFSSSHWGVMPPQDPASAPPFSASLLQPDTWAEYHGAEPVDDGPAGEGDDSGIVHPANQSAAPADDDESLWRVRLWPNQPGADEKRFLARFSPAVREPDYAHRIPGAIGFDQRLQAKNLEILPDQGVQEYVANVGRSLVPEYQRVLPDRNEDKVRFRFYVVHGERPLWNDEMDLPGALQRVSRRNLQQGVAAYPNGVVVIPDTMLAGIANEAQLATILSSAIASVLQKQTFIIKGSNPASRPTCGHCPDLSDELLALSMHAQALRVGIRQMYLAGFDIREAPFAWAAAAGKPLKNPIIDSPGTEEQIPWYTAYAFHYISQFYSEVNYGKLKRGEAEYAQFLVELRIADPAAFEHGIKASSCPSSQRTQRMGQPARKAAALQSMTTDN